MVDGLDRDLLTGRFGVAVPEPSTWLLLLVATGCMAICVRRRGE